MKGFVLLIFLAHFMLCLQSSKAEAAAGSNPQARGQRVPLDWLASILPIRRQSLLIILVALVLLLSALALDMKMMSHG